MIIDLHDNLATRLRRLMQQSNLSEAELARATQLPQPTIHRLISGDTLDPRISTLQVLADYFKVTVDYILAKAPLLPHSELSLLRFGNNRLLPIIEWEDVTALLSDRQQVVDKYAEKGEWATTELALSQNAFALRSRPSMEPRFSRGTLILIEPTNIARDGDLVLIHYIEEKQLALRSVLIDGVTKILQSLTLPTVAEAFDENKQVIGVVMQSKFTFHEDKK